MLEIKKVAADVACSCLLCWEEAIEDWYAMHALTKLDALQLHAPAELHAFCAAAPGVYALFFGGVLHQDTSKASAVALSRWPGVELFTL
jgi:hypothetical protein